jgi:Fe-S cluster assembly ATP-binding protein
VELPGVNNTYFLKEALNASASARRGRSWTRPHSCADAEKLKVCTDDSLLKRPVNFGFSGGEKKRNEIFQMALLEPKLAILDETDSGLDIDALRIVADGVNALRSPERSMIVVTHYQRLLDYIQPDYVHVLANGRIIRSGGKELALELEEKGYGWIVDAHRVVLVNGRYSSALSDLGDLPRACVFGSLRETLAQDPDALEGC